MKANFLENSSKGYFNQPLDSEAPIVMCDCIAFLNSRGMRTPGIFRIPGDENVMSCLKETYDSHYFNKNIKNNNGISVITQINPTPSVFDVAGLLKLFFKGLKPHLISEEMGQNMMDVVTENKNIKDIENGLSKCIEAMPKPNRECLSFLISFLREVHGLQEHNQMNAEYLAVSFVLSLFECGKNLNQLQMLGKGSIVIKYLIGHPVRIFLPSLNLIQRNTKYHPIQGKILLRQYVKDMVSGLSEESVSGTQSTGSMWKRFVQFFSEKMSNSSNVKNDDDAEYETLLIFKGATYIVLRLDEAVCSIFRTHPFRGRGSMFVSALAFKFCNILDSPKPDSSDNVFHWLNGRSPIKQQRKGSMISVGSGNPWLRRRGTMGSKASVRTTGSIHSAFSMFSNIVKEKKESSVDSSRSGDTDSFLGDMDLTEVMDNVLEKHGYMETEDVQDNLNALKTILIELSERRKKFVNRIWKQELFNPRFSSPDDESALLQSTLSLLMQVNVDVCGSRRLHFQHSRFVKQLRKLKMETELSEAVFYDWICSRDKLDKESSGKLHPIHVLRFSISDKLSMTEFNALERKQFLQFHKDSRRRREARRKEVHLMNFAPRKVSSLFGDPPLL